MWNLKHKTDEQTKQSKTRLIENRLVAATGEGVWGAGKLGEGDQEKQTSSYKINNSWR